MPVAWAHFDTPMLPFAPFWASDRTPEAWYLSWREQAFPKSGRASAIPIHSRRSPGPPSHITPRPGPPFAIGRRARQLPVLPRDPPLILALTLGSQRACLVAETA